MGLGLQGAFGIQGGFDTLNEIIALRKKDELIAQAEKDRQRQLALQEAAQRDNEAYRQMTFQGLERQRKIQDEDRDQAQRDRKDAADQAAKDRQAAIIKTRLETLPPDSLGSEGDRADAASVGLDALYTPKATLPQAHGMVEHIGGAAPVDPSSAPGMIYSKGPTYTQQKDAAAAEERKGAAKDMASLRLAIAAMGQNKQPPAYYNALPSTASPTGVVLVDARTGTVKFPDMPAGSAPGLIGPLARDAAKAAAPTTAFINSLDTLQAVGEKHNWQGLGIVPGVRGMLARSGLVSAPPGMIEMQAAVDDVRSFIGHQRYGAALTSGEKQILNSFVANSYTPGKITREMVEAVKNIELGVLQKAQEGPFGPLNRQPRAPEIGATPGAGVPDPFGGVLDQFAPRK